MHMHLYNQDLEVVGLVIDLKGKEGEGADRVSDRPASNHMPLNTPRMCMAQQKFNKIGRTAKWRLNLVRTKLRDAHNDRSFTKQ